MKYLIVCVLLGCSNFLLSQAPVDVSGFPSSVSQPLKYVDVDGSGLTQYVCYAKPTVPNSTNPGYNYSKSVTATTLTSVVVATNVGTVTTAAAHGLLVGNKVVLSGSTTSALNGTYYVQTVTSTTAFTITTSGVADATYNNGALTLTVSTPLLTGAIWSIMKLTYASSQLLSIQWAGGTPGNYSFVCANRTTTTGAAAIYYW